MRLMRIPVGATELTKSHKDAVARVLDSGQISPGAVCREFEEKFAARHGAAHGLFVNSGTDALRIAVLALKEKYGWLDGSSVIVPTCTFVATANVVIQAGLRPLFVDVGMYDGNLNPFQVEHLYECSKTDDIVAMIPVHLFGKICEMDYLMEIAKKHKLRVIEDSCESMGVGTLKGDVACYSTYVCHVISTGVGGLAITQDKKLSELMRSIANHGRSMKHLPGYKNGAMSSRFQFDRLGYSARPTEMQAALGLVELANLDRNVKRRREIAMELYEGLSDIGHLHLPMPFEAAHAFMMFPIAMAENSKIKKESLCKYLENNGIETRDWLHLLGKPFYDQGSFMGSTVAEMFRNTGFYIGCHPGMTGKDVAYVIKTIRKFFANIDK